MYVIECPVTLLRNVLAVQRYLSYLNPNLFHHRPVSDDYVLTIKGRMITYRLFIAPEDCGRVSLPNECGIDLAQLWVPRTCEKKLMHGLCINIDIEWTRCCENPQIIRPQSFGTKAIWEIPYIIHGSLTDRLGYGELRLQSARASSSVFLAGILPAS